MFLCFYWQFGAFTRCGDHLMSGCGKWKTSPTSSRVCGETASAISVVCFISTSNILHPDRPLSRAEYLRSKTIPAYESKMEMSVLARCPKGNWQIKWFATVEELDNDVGETLHCEEYGNNSEGRFGPRFTTHVCCSLWVRQVYGLLVRQNIVPWELEWLQSANHILAPDGRLLSLSHTRCVRPALLCFVVMDTAAWLLERTFILFIWGRI